MVATTVLSRFLWCSSRIERRGCRLERLATRHLSQPLPRAGIGGWVAKRRPKPPKFRPWIMRWLVLGLACTMPRCVAACRLIDHLKRRGESQRISAELGAGTVGGIRASC